MLSEVQDADVDLLDAAVAGGSGPRVDQVARDSLEMTGPSSRVGARAHAWPRSSAEPQQAHTRQMLGGVPRASIRSARSAAGDCCDSLLQFLWWGCDDAAVWALKLTILY